MVLRSSSVFALTPKIFSIEHLPDEIFLFYHQVDAPLSDIKFVVCDYTIEIFFEDVKELLGIDYYQLMISQGLLRYWSLCWIAFSFLVKHHYELQERRYGV